MKRYTSFKEIDRDLKYLKLKSKINLEELRLGLYSVQEEVKETISPMNLITNALGSVAKTTLVGGILDRVVGMNFFGKNKDTGSRKRKRKWKLF